MSNLIKHAERELALLGGADDQMQQAMNEHLLKMVALFAEEGHSGFSAGYALGCLKKLLAFEPLTPLTGADDEWNDMSKYSNEPTWQNNRCSRVFKRADGTAYDIDGKVFVEPSGTAFTSGDSHVPVTFPYVPKTEYVEV